MMIEAIPDWVAQREAHYAMLARIEAERDEYIQTIQKWQRIVFTAFLERLSQDPELREVLKVVQPVPETAAHVAPAARESGPTLRTQMRFKVFKRLKDDHPTWSQSRVTQEAIPELGEIVDAETVRNTYRAMGVDWERGDRVR